LVDGLHILIRNRTKKPLAIALSGAGRGSRGRDDGGDVTNIQYKPIWIVTTNLTYTIIYTNLKLF
jgi:hypothetical protein